MVFNPKGPDGFFQVIQNILSCNKEVWLIMTVSKDRIHIRLDLDQNNSNFDYQILINQLTAIQVNFILDNDISFKFKLSSMTIKFLNKVVRQVNVQRELVINKKLRDEQAKYSLLFKVNKNGVLQTCK